MELRKNIKERIYLLFENDQFIGYTYERAAVRALTQMVKNLDIKIEDAQELRKEASFLYKKEVEAVVDLYREANYKHYLIKYIKFNPHIIAELSEEFINEFESKFQQAIMDELNAELDAFLKL